jgi:hypothetical protein
MTELEPQFMEVVETSALELRKAFEFMQAGALNAGDLRVTAGATGRSVDVAAGLGYINGTHVVDQGRYRIRNDAVKNSDAFVLGGIPANTSGLPRLDQIVARIYDQTHDNSGQRKWQLEVFAGTPVAGVTLDNRSGFTPIPLSSMLLADVVTPSGATSVLPANIRDRRTQARGVSRLLERTAGNLTVNGGAYVRLENSAGTVALASRIECNGSSRFKFKLNAGYESAAIQHNFFALFMDAVFVAGTERKQVEPTAVYGWEPHLEWSYTPPAGSHVFEVYWHNQASGITTVYANATTALQFSIEEDMRPNADNT